LFTKIVAIHMTHTRAIHIPAEGALPPRDGVLATVGTILVKHTDFFMDDMATWTLAFCSVIVMAVSCSRMALYQ
jgi:hypothetical protein